MDNRLARIKKKREQKKRAGQQKKLEDEINSKKS